MNASHKFIFLYSLVSLLPLQFFSTLLVVIHCYKEERQIDIFFSLLSNSNSTPPFNKKLNLNIELNNKFFLPTCLATQLGSDC